MSNDDPLPSTSDLGPRVGVESSPSSLPIEAGSSFEEDEGRKIRSQQARRVTFLDDLVRSLDIMIYCQLSVLYYMDCSLLRFLLRAIPHWVFFTPKPAFFPPQPKHNRYVSSILAVNSFSVALHLLLQSPEGGEAMRGYLHGGLLVDFVGELGPISKLRLVYFDVLVMLLQFAMLAVFLDRRELKRVMDAPIVLEPGTRATVPSRTQQDHDSEERGLRRFDRAMASERTAFLGQGEEEEEDTDSRTRRSEHHLDALYSGQIVIADLHIIDTIKSSWWWSYGPAE